MFSFQLITLLSFIEKKKKKKVLDLCVIIEGYENNTPSIQQK